MRDIGVDVKVPTGEWDGDENCPFYGSLRLRGQVLEGVVSSVGMQKSITIERNTYQKNEEIRKNGEENIFSNRSLAYMYRRSECW